MTELLLAAHPCTQCLTTRRRVVSGPRAAEIVRECRAENKHFFCHKGSMAGEQVHCAGVNRIVPGRAYDFAVAHGIPVRLVDPDALC